MYQAGTYVFEAKHMCHGVHIHVRGQPQVLGLTLHFVDTGSVVDGCMHQDIWPLSCQRVSLLPSHLRSAGIVEVYQGLLI